MRETRTYPNYNAELFELTDGRWIAQVWANETKRTCVHGPMQKHELIDVLNKRFSEGRDSNPFSFFFELNRSPATSTCPRHWQIKVVRKRGADVTVRSCSPQLAILDAFGQLQALEQLGCGSASVPASYEVRFTSSHNLWKATLFLEGDKLAEGQTTDTLEHALEGALEAYSWDMPDDSTWIKDAREESKSRGPKTFIVRLYREDMYSPQLWRAVIYGRGKMIGSSNVMRSKMQAIQAAFGEAETYGGI